MRITCNNESILVFEKLTPLPFHLVFSHLKHDAFLLIALLSKKWETLIRKNGKGVESEWNVEITKNEVSVQVGFYINRKDWEFESYKTLKVCFKPNSDLEMEMTEDVRVHQEKNLITFYHKTNQHLEDTCFKALQLLEFLFPPTSYRNITVSLGPRSPEFPFRFLLQLPRGTAEYMKLHADQEVDGTDLVKFLSKVRVNSSSWGTKYMLDISAKIKNLVKCKEDIFETLQSRNKSAKITDARFIPNDFMKQFCFVFSEFGQNDFTSKDFNVFLRCWMRRRDEEEYDGARMQGCRATFEIREDQKIKMKKVMKGLKPHVGKPRIRDRWRFESPTKDEQYAKVTDFGDGWDIKNSKGEIGTVLLEPNRLTFFVWSSSSQWIYRVSSKEDSIRKCTRHIQLANRKRERIQKKVDAGKMELFPDQQAFLKNYPEKIKSEQERLAYASEIKEKLLTVWNNDDTVYVPPPPRVLNNNATRPIVLVGAANIALDRIPLALRFTRHRDEENMYTKIHDRCKISIALVNVFDITYCLNYPVSDIIYAYSDSDSFDRLSELFILLRKMILKDYYGPIREASSILVHLPPGSDRKDTRQPDPFDVESFQKSTWSDLYEFDPNSLTDIEDFVVPF